MDDAQLQTYALPGGTLRLLNPLLGHNACQMPGTDGPCPYEARYLWRWHHDSWPSTVEVPVCFRCCARMRAEHQPTRYSVCSLEDADV